MSAFALVFFVFLWCTTIYPFQSQQETSCISHAIHNLNAEAGLCTNMESLREKRFGRSLETAKRLCKQYSCGAGSLLADLKLHNGGGSWKHDYLYLFFQFETDFKWIFEEIFNYQPHCPLALSRQYCSCKIPVIYIVIQLRHAVAIFWIGNNNIWLQFMLGDINSLLKPSLVNMNHW